MKDLRGKGGGGGITLQLVSVDITINERISLNCVQQIMHRKKKYF